MQKMCHSNHLSIAVSTSPSLFRPKFSLRKRRTGAIRNSTSGQAQHTRDVCFIRRCRAAIRSLVDKLRRDAQRVVLRRHIVPRQQQRRSRLDAIKGVREVGRRLLRK